MFIPGNFGPLAEATKPGVNEEWNRCQTREPEPDHPGSDPPAFQKCSEQASLGCFS